MRIVVTGGSGDLGARVVRHLEDRGHDVLAASRRTGADLATGAGLAVALDGAEAVVHCATSPRRSEQVDVQGARRVAEVLRAQQRPAHLVAVSIVGCDRVPYAYYRAKRRTEQVLEHAGVPATVVRATQFHALAAHFTRLFALGRLGLSIGDLRLQPVDVDWVARRLADLAEGAPPDGWRRATDLAGPEVFGLGELDALVAAHDARPPHRVLRLPPVGGLMRAFGSGALVPEPGAAELGGRSFAQWLADQATPLPRGMHDRS